MSSFRDENIINQIATYERSIAGVRNSYGYSQNPDNLLPAMLPAVMHYVPSFTSQPRAHHNLWRNAINVSSIIFVAPRQGQGGRLKYLENEAIPFMDKWRTKFQEHDVIANLLSTTGSVKAWITGGTYGAGGLLLSAGGVDFIGAVMSWRFENA